MCRQTRAGNDNDIQPNPKKHVGNREEHRGEDKPHCVEN
jgi:hypothetical protein